MRQLLQNSVIKEIRNNYNKKKEVHTMQEITKKYVESNRVKQEVWEKIMYNMNGLISNEQMKKLEEAFMSCAKEYVFQKKGE